MNKVQNIENQELIDSSRISVVIQGLTHYIEGNDNCLFYQCVNSIKKYLPDAEIIVSTWIGQKCDETVVDCIIYNIEPNSIVTSNNLNNQWNFNKMIVSTLGGLNASTREYVLKIRADLILSGVDFFRICTKKNIPKKFNRYKIFDEPINVTNIFIKYPFSYHHFLFHLSDVVQFGKITNMLDLWNRDLVGEAELCFDLKWNSAFNYYCDTQMKNSPEQALMIGWMKDNDYDINLPYSTYVSSKFLKLSELLISMNFNVLDWSKSNVVFPERFVDNKKLLNNYIYKAEELNDLYIFYETPFYFLNRCFKLYLNFYFLKFLNKDFIDNFVRTFLFWICPSLFFKIQSKWKLFFGKGNSND